MRRKWRLILLALAAYGLFVLVTIPARVVIPYLQAELPPSMRLADVRGSVWSGDAALLAVVPPQGATLSQVHFIFLPWSLLGAKWGYALHFTGALQGHMDVAVGSQSMTISQLSLLAHVGALVVLMPAVQNFGPTGVLHVTAAHLHWGSRLAGSGVLTWLRAALVSAPVSPLGDYAARFLLNKGAIHYQVRTLAGRLRVSGQGRYLVATHVLSFAGRVRGRGLRLGGLVQNIGTPAGHGRRAVSFQMPIF